jgi:Holliday junction DNA helicase RuvB
MATPNGSTGEQVQAQTWDDYVGQKRLKARLMIHVKAAIIENRELDHMLLCGPPGVGKSALARLIAEQVGDPFHVKMMPMKEKAFLNFCRDNTGVVLIDEIHAASTKFQEMLQGIQEGVLHFDGKTVDVHHLTFIAATTQPENVIAPLWDRFLIKPEWEDYADDEMAEIVAGMARRANVALPDEVALGLARAAGGTPRIAGSLIAAGRSLAAIGETLTVESILDLAEIDVDGLSSRHMNYLRSLSELGETAGLSSLCSMLQLSQTVVEGLERLLIKRNFIRKDATGRNLTDHGRVKVPGRTPQRLANRRSVA